MSSLIRIVIDKKSPTEPNVGAKDMVGSRDVILFALLMMR